MADKTVLNENSDLGEFITDAENNPFEQTDMSTDDKFAELQFKQKQKARKTEDQLELERLRERVKQLESDTAKDGLTKLFDMQRTAAQEIAQGKIKQAERSGTPVVMLWLDLDKFKSINDTFGHEVGDEVLKAFARSLESATRDEDFPFVDIAEEGGNSSGSPVSSISYEVEESMPFRSGGEEFGILLFGTDLNNVGKVAERISKHFSNEIHNLKKHDSGAAKLWDVTFSGGASQFRVDESFDRQGSEFGIYEEYAAVKKRADELVYKAKDEGRNRLLVETGDGLDSVTVLL